jgi:hypothetical protein
MTITCKTLTAICTYCSNKGAITFVEWVGQTREKVRLCRCKHCGIVGVAANILRCVSYPISTPSAISKEGMVSIAVCRNCCNEGAINFIERIDQKHLCSCRHCGVALCCCRHCGVVGTAANILKARSLRKRSRSLPGAKRLPNSARESNLFNQT